MGANPNNPLFWNVRIVDENGLPMPDFARSMQQQRTINASIPDLTTQKNVSKVLDVIGAARGDLLYRGALYWSALLPSTTNFILTTKGPNADPVYQSLSSLLDLLGGTQGDILYRSASGWTALPPSATNGFVLTYNTATHAPEWDAGGGGSGGGAASVKDDGTNVYIAMSDSSGQLVLDSMGNPIFSLEVFPVASLQNALPMAMIAASLRF